MKLKSLKNKRNGEKKKLNKALDKNIEKCWIIGEC
jgi:hypothetical protein